MYETIEFLENIARRLNFSELTKIKSFINSPETNSGGLRNNIAYTSETTKKAYLQN